MISLILVFFIGLLTFSCDQATQDDIERITGDWKLIEDIPDADFYIRITPDNYTEAGSVPGVGCGGWMIDGYMARTGTLTLVRGDQERVVVARRNGTMLIIESDDTAFTYEPTDDFPGCENM